MRPLIGATLALVSTLISSVYVEPVSGKEGVGDVCYKQVGAIYTWTCESDLYCDVNRKYGSYNKAYCRRRHSKDGEPCFPKDSNPHDAGSLAGDYKWGMCKSPYKCVVANSAKPLEGRCRAPTPAPTPIPGAVIPTFPVVTQPYSFINELDVAAEIGEVCEIHTDMRFGHWISKSNIVIPASMKRECASGLVCVDNQGLHSGNTINLNDGEIYRYEGKVSYCHEYVGQTDQCDVSGVGPKLTGLPVSYAFKLCDPAYDEIVCAVTDTQYPNRGICTRLADTKRPTNKPTTPSPTKTPTRPAPLYVGKGEYCNSEGYTGAYREVYCKEGLLCTYIDGRNYLRFDFQTELWDGICMDPPIDYTKAPTVPETPYPTIPPTEPMPVTLGNVQCQSACELNHFCQSADVDGGDTVTPYVCKPPVHVSDSPSFSVETMHTFPPKASRYAIVGMGGDFFAVRERGAASTLGDQTYIFRTTGQYHMAFSRVSDSASGARVIKEGDGLPADAADAAPAQASTAAGNASASILHSFFIPFDADDDAGGPSITVWSEPKPWAMRKVVVSFNEAGTLIAIGDKVYPCCYEDDASAPIVSFEEKGSLVVFTGKGNNAIELLPILSNIDDGTGSAYSRIDKHHVACQFVTVEPDGSYRVSSQKAGDYFQVPSSFDNILVPGNGTVYFEYSGTGLLAGYSPGIFSAAPITWNTPSYHGFQYQSSSGRVAFFRDDIDLLHLVEERTGSVRVGKDPSLSNVNTGVPHKGPDFVLRVNSGLLAGSLRTYDEALRMTRIPLELLDKNAQALSMESGTIFVLQNTELQRVSFEYGALPPPTPEPTAQPTESEGAPTMPPTAPADTSVFFEAEDRKCDGSSLDTLDVYSLLDGEDEQRCKDLCLAQTVEECPCFTVQGSTCLFYKDVVFGTAYRQSSTTMYVRGADELRTLDLHIWVTDSYGELHTGSYYSMEVAKVDVVGAEESAMPTIPVSDPNGNATRLLRLTDQVIFIQPTIKVNKESKIEQGLRTYVDVLIVSMGGETEFAHSVYLDGIDVDPSYGETPEAICPLDYSLHTAQVYGSSRRVYFCPEEYLLKTWNGRDHFCIYDAERQATGYDLTRNRAMYLDVRSTFCYDQSSYPLKQFFPFLRGQMELQGTAVLRKNRHTIQFPRETFDDETDYRLRFRNLRPNGVMAISEIRFLTKEGTYLFHVPESDLIIKSGEGLDTHYYCGSPGMHLSGDAEFCSDAGFAAPCCYDTTTSYTQHPSNSCEGEQTGDHYLLETSSECWYKCQVKDNCMGFMLDTASSYCTLKDHFFRPIKRVFKGDAAFDSSCWELCSEDAACEHFQETKDTSVCSLYQKISSKTSNDKAECWVGLKTPTVIAAMTSARYGRRVENIHSILQFYKSWVDENGVSRTEYDSKAYRQATEVAEIELINIPKEAAFVQILPAQQSAFTVQHVFGGTHAIGSEVVFDNDEGYEIARVIALNHPGVYDGNFDVDTMTSRSEAIFETFCNEDHLMLWSKSQIMTKVFELSLLNLDELCHEAELAVDENDLQRANIALAVIGANVATVIEGMFSTIRTMRDVLDIETSNDEVELTPNGLAATLESLQSFGVVLENCDMSNYTALELARDVFNAYKMPEDFRSACLDQFYADRMAVKIGGGVGSDAYVYKGMENAPCFTNAQCHDDGYVCISFQCKRYDSINRMPSGETEYNVCAPGTSLVAPSHYGVRPQRKEHHACANGVYYTDTIYAGTWNIGDEFGTCRLLEDKSQIQYDRYYALQCPKMFQDNWVQTVDTTFFAERGNEQQCAGWEANGIMDLGTAFKTELTGNLKSTCSFKKHEEFFNAWKGVYPRLVPPRPTEAVKTYEYEHAVTNTASDDSSVIRKVKSMPAPMAYRDGLKLGEIADFLDMRCSMPQEYYATMFETSQMTETSCASQIGCSWHAALQKCVASREAVQSFTCRLHETEKECLMSGYCAFDENMGCYSQDTTDYTSTANMCLYLQSPKTCGSVKECVWDFGSLKCSKDAADVRGWDPALIDTNSHDGVKAKRTVNMTFPFTETEKISVDPDLHLKNRAIPFCAHGLKPSYKVVYHEENSEVIGQLQDDTTTYTTYVPYVDEPTLAMVYDYKDFVGDPENDRRHYIYTKEVPGDVPFTWETRALLRVNVSAPVWLRRPQNSGVQCLPAEILRNPDMCALYGFRWRRQQCVISDGDEKDFFKNIGHNDLETTLLAAAENTEVRKKESKQSYNRRLAEWYNPKPAFLDLVAGGVASSQHWRVPGGLLPCYKRNRQDLCEDVKKAECLWLGHIDECVHKTHDLQGAASHLFFLPGFKVPEFELDDVGADKFYNVSLNEAAANGWDWLDRMQNKFPPRALEGQMKTDWKMCNHEILWECELDERCKWHYGDSVCLPAVCNAVPFLAPSAIGRLLSTTEDVDVITAKARVCDRMLGCRFDLLSHTCEPDTGEETGLGGLHTCDWSKPGTVMKPSAHTISLCPMGTLQVEGMCVPMQHDKVGDMWGVTCPFGLFEDIDLEAELSKVGVTDDDDENYLNFPILSEFQDPDEAGEYIWRLRFGTFFGKNKYAATSSEVFHDKEKRMPGCSWTGWLENKDTLADEKGWTTVREFTQNGVECLNATDTAQPAKPAQIKPFDRGDLWAAATAFCDRMWTRYDWCDMHVEGKDFVCVMLHNECLPRRFAFGTSTLDRMEQFMDEEFVSDSPTRSTAGAIVELMRSDKNGYLDTVPALPVTPANTVVEDDRLEGSVEFFFTHFFDRADFELLPSSDPSDEALSAAEELENSPNMMNNEKMLTYFADWYSEVEIGELRWRNFNEGAFEHFPYTQNVTVKALDLRNLRFSLHKYLDSDMEKQLRRTIFKEAFYHLALNVKFFHHGITGGTVQTPVRDAISMEYLAYKTELFIDREEQMTSRVTFAWANLEFTSSDEYFTYVAKLYRDGQLDSHDQRLAEMKEESELQALSRALATGSFIDFYTTHAEIYANKELERLGERQEKLKKVSVGVMASKVAKYLIKRLDLYVDNLLQRAYHLVDTERELAALYIRSYNSAYNWYETVSAQGEFMLIDRVFDQRPYKRRLLRNAMVEPIRIVKARKSLFQSVIQTSLLTIKIEKLKLAYASMPSGNSICGITCSLLENTPDPPVSPPAPAIPDEPKLHLKKVPSPREADYEVITERVRRTTTRLVDVDVPVDNPLTDKPHKNYWVTESMVRDKYGKEMLAKIKSNPLTQKGRVDARLNKAITQRTQRINKFLFHNRHREAALLYQNHDLIGGGFSYRDEGFQILSEYYGQEITSTYDAERLQAAADRKVRKKTRVTRQEWTTKQTKRLKQEYTDLVNSVSKENDLRKNQWILEHDQWQREFGNAKRESPVSVERTRNSALEQDVQDRLLENRRKKQEALDEITELEMRREEWYQKTRKNRLELTEYKTSFTKDLAKKKKNIDKIPDLRKGAPRLEVTDASFYRRLTNPRRSFTTELKPYRKATSKLKKMKKIAKTVAKIVRIASKVFPVLDAIDAVMTLITLVDTVQAIMWAKDKPGGCFLMDDLFDVGNFAGINGAQFFGMLSLLDGETTDRMKLQMQCAERISYAMHDDSGKLGMVDDRVEVPTCVGSGDHRRNVLSRHVSDPVRGLNVPCEDDTTCQVVSATSRCVFNRCIFPLQYYGQKRCANKVNATSVEISNYFKPVRTHAMSPELGSGDFLSKYYKVDLNPFASAQTLFNMYCDITDRFMEYHWSPFDPLSDSDYDGSDMVCFADCDEWEVNKDEDFDTYMLAMPGAASYRPDSCSSSSDCGTGGICTAWHTCVRNVECKCHDECNGGWTLPNKLPVCDADSGICVEKTPLKAFAGSGTAAAYPACTSPVTCAEQAMARFDCPAREKTQPSDEDDITHRPTKQPTRYREQVTNAPTTLAPTPFPTDTSAPTSARPTMAPTSPTAYPTRAPEVPPTPYPTIAHTVTEAPSDGLPTPEPTTLPPSFVEHYGNEHCELEEKRDSHPGPLVQYSQVSFAAHALIDECVSECQLDPYCFGLYSYISVEDGNFRCTYLGKPREEGVESVADTMIEYDNQDPATKAHTVWVKLLPCIPPEDRIGYCLYDTRLGTGPDNLTFAVTRPLIANIGFKSGDSIEKRTENALARCNAICDKEHSCATFRINVKPDFKSVDYCTRFKFWTENMPISARRYTYEGITYYVKQVPCLPFTDAPTQSPTPPAPTPPAPTSRPTARTPTLPPVDGDETSGEGCIISSVPLREKAYIYAFDTYYNSVYATTTTYEKFAKQCKEELRRNALGEYAYVFTSVFFYRKMYTCYNYLSVNSEYAPEDPKRKVMIGGVSTKKSNPAFYQKALPCRTSSPTLAPTPKPTRAPTVLTTGEPTPAPTPEPTHTYFSSGTGCSFVSIGERTISSSGVQHFVLQRPIATFSSERYSTEAEILASECYAECRDNSYCAYISTRGSSANSKTEMEGEGYQRCWHWTALTDGKTITEVSQEAAVVSDYASFILVKDAPCDTPKPTMAPTLFPTDAPTNAPTLSPTDAPTDAPTAFPTDAPTPEPTKGPTNVPTNAPTDAPTPEPTKGPTNVPTNAPTDAPTYAPTQRPTFQDLLCNYTLFMDTTEVGLAQSSGWTPDVPSTTECVILCDEDYQCTGATFDTLRQRCFLHVNKTVEAAVFYAGYYTHVKQGDAPCPAVPTDPPTLTMAPTPNPTMDFSTCPYSQSPSPSDESAGPLLTREDLDAEVRIVTNETMHEQGIETCEDFCTYLSVGCYAVKQIALGDIMDYGDPYTNADLLEQLYCVLVQAPVQRADTRFPTGEEFGDGLFMVKSRNTTHRDACLRPLPEETPVPTNTATPTARPTPALNGTNSPTFAPTPNATLPEDEDEDEDETCEYAALPAFQPRWDQRVVHDTMLLSESLASCKASCDMEIGCVGFSRENVTETCTLYSGIGPVEYLLEGNPNNATLYLKSSRCNVLHPTAYSFCEYNRTLSTTLVSDLATNIPKFFVEDSVSECAFFCDAFLGCTHFVFNYLDKACLFYKKGAEAVTSSSFHTVFTKRAEFCVAPSMASYDSNSPIDPPTTTTTTDAPSAPPTVSPTTSPTTEQTSSSAPTATGGGGGGDVGVIIEDLIDAIFGKEIAGSGSLIGVLGMILLSTYLCVCCCVCALVKSTDRDTHIIHEQYAYHSPTDNYYDPYWGAGWGDYFAQAAQSYGYGGYGSNPYGYGQQYT